jgi:hypothetical protein
VALTSDTSQTWNSYHLGPRLMDIGLLYEYVFILYDFSAEIVCLYSFGSSIDTKHITLHTKNESVSDNVRNNIISIL